MANTMRTYIKIKNVDQNVVDSFYTWLSDQTKYSVIDKFKLFNNVYGTDFSDTNRPPLGWVDENIGSKWVEFEYDYVDDQEIKFNIETAWDVPFRFIYHLQQYFTNIKENIYITGVFEDESYDPCGAFVYAFEYDDVEYFDDDIDFDRMWEDDDYREQVLEQLFQMEVDLEHQYLSEFDD